MDIDKTIYQLQIQLEEYEEAHDPEKRLDLKQTIQAKIKDVKEFFSSKTMDEGVFQSISDIEEVLSY